MKRISEAVRNSPVFGRKYTAYSQTKTHDKFEDDWLHSRDPVDAGVTFYLKYLGMSHVQKSHGVGSTDEAVKRIACSARTRSSKLQKIKLTISSRAVELLDTKTEMKLDHLPLYRVSYCCVDATYDKVCSYIARNPETLSLECHAFLCDSKSKAEAVTLTVAQAFNIAYERWQEAKKKKKAAAEKTKTGSPDLGVEIESPSQNEPIKKPIKLSELKDGNDSAISDTPSPQPDERPPPSRLKRRPSLTTDDLTSDFLVKPTMSKTKSMDRVNEEDELEKEFSMLAEARSNPNLLDDCDVKPNKKVLELQKSERRAAGELSRSLDNLIMF